MKLYSSSLAGTFVLSSLFLADVNLDCKDVAAGGLINGLFWVAAMDQIDQRVQDEVDRRLAEQNGGDSGQGAPGVPGPAGFSCWDLNQNGEADADEDRNGDGEVNTLDCAGADGTDGQDGATGTAGADGAAGRDGANGTDGADGRDGANGQDGVDGRNGTDGLDGLDGLDGIDGIHCWDTNGNGVADEAEDVNGDGSVDVLDCRGLDAAGLIVHGVVSENGTPHSGDNFDSARMIGGAGQPLPGFYEIHAFLPTAIDISGMAHDDFIVLVTPRQFTFGEAESSYLVAYYTTVSLVDRDLLIRVQFRDFLTGGFQDSPFSFVVLAP